MSCPLCEKLKNGESPLFVTKFGDATLFVGDHSLFPAYFVLVVDRHIKEMHELEPKDQQSLFTALTRIGAAIEKAFEVDKINYASYGNMIPHIHWHIFGRKKGDAAWPNPVWALMDEFSKHPVTPENARPIAERLRKSLGI